MQQAQATRGRPAGSKRTPPRIDRVIGWEVGDWSEALSWSRRKTEMLLRGNNKLTPKTVKIGRHRRIVESPREYLDRVLRQQNSARAKAAACLPI